MNLQQYCIEEELKNKERAYLSRKFRVINRETRQSKIMSTSEYLIFSNNNNMNYYAVSRYKPKVSKCLIVNTLLLLTTVILTIL